MIEYGVAYFSIAFPLIPLFFVIMKAVQLKGRESPNITYILMNMVNFCQLGQAFSHLISGPLLILPQLLIKLNVIVRIIGCVMNSLWIADFPLMTLLAATRILIFSNVIDSKTFPILIKLMLCSIIMWTLFLIIVGSLTQNFLLVTPGWDYDFTVSNAEIFATLEVIISFACLALSYVSYILMVYLIYASTFVTTYITVMIFVWHQSLFSMVSFIDMDNQKNQAILNCCLILHCYVNPILTLVCNKSIRDEFLKLLGIRTRKPYINGVVSKLSSIHPTETSPN